jgi:hypothetical protein
MNIEKPWVTGPKELLNHGLNHLYLETDFDSRIAMISIDNSVELMIKTYLGLPKRITKIEGLTRKKYEEIVSGFPSLIDGLEEYASDKLTGIELGDIEWFHRVRNQLYHDGNGITVEKSKVETYAEIAKILFENLFDINFTLEETGNHTSLIGEFIKKWAVFEGLLLELSNLHLPTTLGKSPMMNIRALRDKNIFDEEHYKLTEEVRTLRNNTVHGMSNPSNSDLKEFNKKLDKLIQYVKKKK